MRSSYIENNYGSVFRSLVLASKPELIVECGVLDGYSLCNMASAVKFNHLKKGVFGHIYAFDLWESYEYKHGDFCNVQDMLAMNHVIDYVDLVNNDAFEAAESFKDGDVDILHMDISNDGDKLVETLLKWGKKISKDGMILFEGGSEERDQIDWMVNFNKTPIRTQLYDNPLVWESWEFQVFDPFPSLTILWKKKGKLYDTIG